MFDQIKAFINPSKNPDLTQAHEFQRKYLPTLWLLGKTGAGKSSFIQTLTGLS
ncbi:MAG: kinase, partial [Aliivibrio sp.]|nr:kinase [Aliivibrio sp.]